MARGSRLVAHVSRLAAHFTDVAQGSWLMAKRRYGVMGSRPKGPCAKFFLAMSHEL